MLHFYILTSVIIIVFIYLNIMFNQLHKQRIYLWQLRADFTYSCKWLWVLYITIITARMHEFKRFWLHSFMAIWVIRDFSEKILKFWRQEIPRKISPNVFLENGRYNFLGYPSWKMIWGRFLKVVCLFVAPVLRSVSEVWYLVLKYRRHQILDILRISCLWFSTWHRNCWLYIC